MSDQEIGRSVGLQPIVQVAEERLGIPRDALSLYGDYKAKVSTEFVQNSSKGNGKLILVTAMSPTPAGEGKTTTTLGLTDALNQIGIKASACLREPSLGPSFGMKGGAHGGGRAQVAPMEDINLHFTGDIHAVTSAHNLLASLIDNHLYWGNRLDFDVENINWRRVLDLNDRALRDVSVRVKSKLRRKTGFDITAASEIMAVLCLADDMANLQERLGHLVVGKTSKGRPITANELSATGALSVVLKDALTPNLIQTLEHQAVFMHGGPFANIAHGCNSVIATRTALACSEYVVTEAGFGADLGFEKFVNIKCRQSGLMPDAVVIVATIRALKMHGGVALEDLEGPSVEAVSEGVTNLICHIENVQKLGFEPIVAVNQFTSDSEAEIAEVISRVENAGATIVQSSHWRDGGKGAVELAQAVRSSIESGQSSGRLLYENDLSLKEKISKVATEIYRADGVDFLNDSSQELNYLEEQGFGQLPICIAKTQYSFSVDANQLGAPTGHRLTVREVNLKAGAGFVVVICGNIMTMPGLPRRPAANQLTLDDQGQIDGLF